jgi:hypothetical protein
MFRSPALTTVALLSLALGIGANTAIFSFLDALMLRSLPVKDPARLVVFGGQEDEAGVTDRYGSTTLYSYPFYRQLQQKNAVFSDVAAIFSFWNNVYGTVDGRDETEQMGVQFVSGSYFQTLGVQPAIGRALTEDDDNSEGDHPVAVISHAWWKRVLASDPAVLNRKIKLGTTMFSIVGVAPPEFFGTKVGEAPDIWVPMSMMKSVPPSLNGYKDNFYQEILMGITALVLLIACANIANPSASTLDCEGTRTSRSCLWRLAYHLCAAHSLSLRRLAVRQALGARRIRIVRQLLTESFEDSGFHRERRE